MLKELKDTDREEISRLIKEGYTEGYLDTENGKHIYWKLQTNIWSDN
jgi:hypothetical protein